MTLMSAGTSPIGLAPGRRTTSGRPGVNVTAKPQILFVDDEACVLAGLRRALHARREAWGLHWAVGGLPALEHLANHRIDILVTDMRMPGMDGAVLLDEVRRHHPEIARIVLSGHADRESIIIAAGAAQQFLAKPCDPATLITALESTLAARAVMTDDRLRAVLGEIENLPKPPGIYAEFTGLASDSQADAAEIVRLVERDVATAAELLKLVNSSFFGVGQQVTSVSRAVALLGVEVIRALVLAGRMFRPAGDLPDDLVAADVAGRAIEAYQSVRRAGAAAGWGEDLTGRLGLAALLYDVGLLALAANQPEEWARYRDLQRELPLRDAQAEAFGVTSGLAGSYLLGLWGFHPTVLSALAEQPIAMGDDLGRSSASPAGLVVAEAHRAATAACAEEGGRA